MIKAISGTPGPPVPFSNNRKLVAFARKAPKVRIEKATYVLMPEAT